jgi:hypothetical protein
MPAEFIDKRKPARPNCGTFNIQCHNCGSWGVRVSNFSRDGEEGIRLTCTECNNKEEL